MAYKIGERLLKDFHLIEAEKEFIIASLLKNTLQKKKRQGLESGRSLSKLSQAEGNLKAVLVRSS